MEDGFDAQFGGGLSNQRESKGLESSRSGPSVPSWKSEAVEESSLQNANERNQREAAPVEAKEAIRMRLDRERQQANSPFFEEPRTEQMAQLQATHLPNELAPKMDGARAILAETRKSA